MKIEASKDLIGVEPGLEVLVRRYVLRIHRRRLQARVDLENEPGKIELVDQPVRLPAGYR